MLLFLNGHYTELILLGITFTDKMSDFELIKHFHKKPTEPAFGDIGT